MTGLVGVGWPAVARRPSPAWLGPAKVPLSVPPTLRPTAKPKGSLASLSSVHVQSPSAQAPVRSALDQSKKVVAKLAWEVTTSQMVRGIK